VLGQAAGSIGHAVVGRPGGAYHQPRVSEGIAGGYSDLLQRLTDRIASCIGTCSSRLERPGC
jgi:hypothetical protein